MKKNSGKSKRVNNRKPAPAGEFTTGQRVTVIAEGSFAKGRAGRVEHVEAGTVFVQLDGKQVAHGFPTSALAAE